MSENLEVIKNSGVMIVYKLDRVSRVDDDFINRLEWPKGLEAQVFVLGEMLKNEKRVAGRITDKGRVWFKYFAIKDELSAWSPKLPQDIQLVPLKTAKDLKRVYTEVRADYYKSIGEVQTPRQLAEDKKFQSRMLPKSRHIHLVKNGKTVALLLVHDHKDFMDEPTDLIPWAWMDPSLSFEEREKVGPIMRAWLKENINSQVQDFTSLATPELHVMDRALGLYPVAIYVLKKK